jgi:hypothetical protein
MKRWMLVPVPDLLTPVTVWEHTPLDYYRYGEYPRFLRPVGAHQPRTEWRLVEQPHRRDC